MATVVLRGDRVLSTDKAIATYKFLAKVKPKMQGNARPGNANAAKKITSARVFEGPNPDELREAGEAYQKYGSMVIRFQFEQFADVRFLGR